MAENSTQQSSGATSSASSKEEAFKALELVASWINNIDSKATYILTVVGVMIGYVFAQDVAGNGGETQMIGGIKKERVVCFVFMTS